ncbi:glycine-rich domain-containing protein [Streptomyces sp. NPDC021100]|uniref:glycine-rich domain-containing protein n=1 Tax=Streptomyces sp. NPDC021100 TaxID=3365114 RepID=UPI0037914A66
MKRSTMTRSAQPAPLSGPDSVAEAADVRTLLGDAFHSVRATVADNNPDISHKTCGRIVDEALKFVVTAARFPGQSIVPSRVVDEGWHALILHTRAYRDLCAELGTFVHHTPERPDAGRYAPEIIGRTTALIEAAGFLVDPGLWGSPEHGLARHVAAKCQHSDDGGPIVIIPKRPGRSAYPVRNGRSTEPWSGPIPSTRSSSK